VGEAVHSHGRRLQLCAHVFQDGRVDAPQREGAAVCDRPLEAHDRPNHVADRPKGPRLRRAALLEAERMADLDGADDGAVRQILLVRGVNERGEQSVLRLVRRHLGARVQHIPALLHAEVAVLDPLDAVEDGFCQQSSSQCDAVSHLAGRTRSSWTSFGRLGRSRCEPGRPGCSRCERPIDRGQLVEAGRVEGGERELSPLRLPLGGLLLLPLGPLLLLPLGPLLLLPLGPLLLLPLRGLVVLWRLDRLLPRLRLGRDQMPWWRLLLPSELGVASELPTWMAPLAGICM
jgi:hypothetical protein